MISQKFDTQTIRRRSIYDQPFGKERLRICPRLRMAWCRFPLLRWGFLYPAVSLNLTRALPLIASSHRSDILGGYRACPQWGLHLLDLQCLATACCAGLWLPCYCSRLDGERDFKETLSAPSGCRTGESQMLRYHPEQRWYYLSTIVTDEWNASTAATGVRSPHSVSPDVGSNHSYDHLAGFHRSIHSCWRTATLEHWGPHDIVVRWRAFSWPSSYHLWNTV